MIGVGIALLVIGLSFPIAGMTKDQHKDYKEKIKKGEIVHTFDFNKRSKIKKSSNKRR